MYPDCAASLWEWNKSLCEETNKWDWNPLHYDVKQGLRVVVRKMLGWKTLLAYTHAGNGNDWATSIHIAANEGRVNMIHNDGNTPLHLLAASDWISVPAKLRRHAITKMLFNKENQTPVDILSSTEKTLPVARPFQRCRLRHCRLGRRDFEIKWKKMQKPEDETESKGMLKDIMEATQIHLVVATLLVTVTFAADTIAFTCSAGAVFNYFYIAISATTAKRLELITVRFKIAIFLQRLAIKFSGINDEDFSILWTVGRQRKLHANTATVEHVKAMTSEMTNSQNAALLNRIDIPLLGLLVSLSQPPGNVKLAVKGRLGDCWFLSAVAVLTEVSRISEVIITPEYNQEGIYTVRFCIQGDWIPVVVDDWIPWSHLVNQHLAPVGRWTDRMKHKLKHVPQGVSFSRTTAGFRNYQSSHDSMMFYIGMRILKTRGRRAASNINLHESFGGTDYVNSREISCEMVPDPDPKGYTIVPTTIHPGEEAALVLSVFTKASISLENL
ncbi:Calpain-type cysteine protease ADL1 [Capsicum baccatum]|uniref:Calpain-type cysteine protease ADL1 n=1 Tax=Capsicum baccatum TaxID=33114 RepID=A0A2G2WVH9_CAPBA|nr:Calpain-type cysteine protease ADL1 [Capsicum baccatum]